MPKRARTKNKNRLKLINVKNSIEMPLPGDLLSQNIGMGQSQDGDQIFAENINNSTNNYVATNIGENITNIEVNKKDSKAP
jgi:hypothetical protein